jgi:hypothetical protein
MYVWFCPVDEPGVYAIVRPDPETTVVCISDGLLMTDVAAAAALLATVEERDWVRTRLGYPTVHQDPTYAVVDDFMQGQTRWGRHMIPEGLLWTGKALDGECEEAAQRQMAGDGAAAQWQAHDVQPPDAQGRRELG